MSRRMALAAIAIALVATAACSGGGNEGDGTSTTSPPTTTTATAITSPSTVTTPASASVPTVKNSGANAAPPATGRDITDLFDNSSQAADLFRWWVQYEVPLEYWDKYATSVEVAKKVDEGGRAACTMLAHPEGTHSAAINMLMRYPYVFDGTEAVAIHMAAIQALCRHRQTGAQPTAIDKNGRIAFAAVPKFRMADGSILTEYDMVWAGKFACFYLERNGFTGLEAFLRQHSVTVRAADPRLQTMVMEQVVAAATRSQCFPQSSLVMNQPWVR